MSLVTRLATLALLMPLSSASLAQEYPNKLIRILLGGGPDAAARMIAEKLQASWGQPVIVENKPQVGGTIMSQEVANSPPDGHTLMFCSSGQFMVLPFYKLNYDMVRDFAPVTQITTMPFVLSVHPSVPAGSARELIALAKAKPGFYNFASSGAGTPPHLVGEMFNIESGIKMVHVPYKTVAQATSDLLGAHVQVMFVVATAALPLLANASIRGLAVSTEKRSPFLPNIPTVAEAAGLPGFSADAWNGFCAPARTPPAIISKLNAEIIRIIRTPDVEKRLAGLGNTIVASTPEAFGIFMAGDRDKWFKYARVLGVVPE